MTRFIIGMVCIMALSGCATRPENGMLAANRATAKGAVSHQVLVATTRSRDDRPGTYFNGERADKLNFASITVDVPPSHKSGNIEWPSSAPGNPETNFVTRDGAFLPDEKQFVAELNHRLAAQPKGKRKVFLFVHGYNTMFAEGLYRFVQVVHDAHAPGVPVFFSWASGGKARDYVYDNNSATIARDGLEHTLRMIAASNADEINVLAHSMGNWVTVEAIRQVRISGDMPAANKVGTIMLAAPDLDIDVFKSEMQRIGKPKKPFLIIVSRDDKALGLSKFIAGGKERLGATGDTAELTKLGAVVLDLSDIEALDSANHGKFAQIAEIGPSLAKVLAASPPDRENAAAGTAMRVLTLPFLNAPITALAAK